MSIPSLSSRDLLVAGLSLLAILLAACLVALVVWRMVDELRFLRRQRLLARYRPVIDELLNADTAGDALTRLVTAARRHRPVLGDLLLASARLQTGDVIPRLRDAAEQLQLLPAWRTDIGSRHWWVRAEALRAIGLLRDTASFDALVAAMNDEHEEVRAAAVDALGRIGDPRCGPVLLARLPDESRHQRARLVEAIRALGGSIMPLLLAHGHEHRGDTAMVLELIGMIGSTTAIDSVLEWTGAEDPAIRTAALRAIGSIGLDNRSFYFALRGLTDPHPDARAMAARALSRSGNPAAVPYLIKHLSDVWVVAAHCATGLRRLGAAGAAALRAQAESTGQGAELARQMIWELTFLQPGPSTAPLAQPS